MPRVLMLYTGGTIGMQPSPQGYIPCAGLAERLAAHLALGDPYRLPTFDVIEMPPLIDSAELMPAAWNRLVAAIAKLTVLLGRGLAGFALRHSLKSAVRGECHLF